MKETMTETYAMRRANGDWFAFEDHGRIRVPLFRSSHDAMMARLRNFGMLLFEPVALDAQLLKELTSAGVGSNADFCIVKTPFASLRRGQALQPAELALLVTNPVHPNLVRNEKGFPSGTPVPRVASKETETWEDVAGSLPSRHGPGARSIKTRTSEVQA